jgi:hypothetical protein
VGAVLGIAVALLAAALVLFRLRKILPVGLIKLGVSLFQVIASGSSSYSIPWWVLAPKCTGFFPCGFPALSRDMPSVSCALWSSVHVSSRNPRTEPNLLRIHSTFPHSRGNRVFGLGSCCYTCDRPDAFQRGLDVMKVFLVDVIR